MLLTLLQPSESLYLPPLLQTHHLSLPSSACYSAKPTPSQDSPIRTPPPYLKLERLLRELGISLPSKLAGDRAAWWTVAVKEVQWDLGEERVKVTFVDGTVEVWSLADDEVESDGDEVMDESSVEVGVERWVEETLGEGTKASEKGKGREVEGTSVYNRLLALCGELRDAYKDIGGALGSLKGEGGRIDVDEELKLLLDLSADPSLPLPPAWSIPTTSTAPSSVPHARRHVRSSTPSVADDDDDSHRSDDESVASSVDPFEHSGTFTSRRRPTSFPPSHPLSHARLNAYDPISSSFELLSSNRQPHDLLSFIALLSRTRSTLVDLFSSYIIPVLKDRLPPTYGLWTTSNALATCRRIARLQSGDVASLILQLIQDEGEEWDVSDDDDEEEEEEEEEEEDEEDELAGMSEAEDGWNDTRLEKKERRMERNVMFEMRDDWGLRMWCEKAQARALEEREEGGEEDCVLLDEVRPWEVSKSISHVSKTASKAKRGRKIKLGMRKKKISSAYDFDDTFDSSGASDSSSSSTSDDFFYPSDPLQESLLPAKLPKTVIKRSPFPPLGRDMSRLRSQLHSALNELAGLQRKMVQLIDFIDTQTVHWESIIAEERKEKVPAVKKKSSSRSMTPKIRVRKLKVAKLKDTQLEAELVSLGEEAESHSSSLPPRDEKDRSTVGVEVMEQRRQSLVERASANIETEVDSDEGEGGPRKKIKLDKSLVVLGESNRATGAAKKENTGRSSPPRRPPIIPNTRLPPPRIIISAPSPNTSPTLVRMSLDDLSTHRHAVSGSTNHPASSDSDHSSSMDEDLLTESDPEDHEDIQVDHEDSWKAFRPYEHRPFETFEQYQLSHRLRSSPSPPPTTFTLPPYPTSSERSLPPLPTKPSPPSFGNHFSVPSLPLPSRPLHFAPTTTSPTAHTAERGPIQQPRPPTVVSRRPRTPEKERIEVIAEEGEGDEGKASSDRQVGKDEPSVDREDDERGEGGRPSEQEEEAGSRELLESFVASTSRSQRLCTPPPSSSCHGIDVDEVTEGIGAREVSEDIQVWDDAGEDLLTT